MYWALFWINCFFFFFLFFAGGGNQTPCVCRQRALLLSYGLSPWNRFLSNNSQTVCEVFKIVRKVSWICSFFLVEKAHKHQNFRENHCFTKPLPEVIFKYFLKVNGLPAENGVLIRQSGVSQVADIFNFYHFMLEFPFTGFIHLPTIR